MDCKRTWQKLNDYLDGSLGKAEEHAFEAHLKTCNSCEPEVRALRLLLSEAGTLEKKSAPAFLWQSIERELDSEERSPRAALVTKAAEILSKVRRVFLFPAPAVKLAGALAVLLVGVFIGRHLLSGLQTDQLVPAVADTSAHVQLVRRASNYLDKSKILFLGLVNADESDLMSSDWSLEQDAARNLIQEAAFLKENLSDKRDARVKQLIEDLELILLEIANLEKEQDLENIDLIRSGIDRKGLLLKINLQAFSEDEKANDPHLM